MDKARLESRLKQLIKQDGRSQAWVARRIGTSPDTFNKWVRGVNRIPDTVLAQVCEHLGAPKQVQAELMELAGYVVVGKVASKVKPPFQFASRIAPNGLALDPASTFSASVTDIYAVFSPQFPLAGTTVSEGEPQSDSYYAFLSVPKGSRMTRLGWRWYLNGQVVNDFEMDVSVGNIVWLQKFYYGEGGIFNSAPFTPGTYRIIVLMGGNPSVSAELTIV